MPIFPFRCEDCFTDDEEFNFERLLSYDKATAGGIECPVCSGTNTTKMIGTAAIHMGLTVAQKSAGTKKSRVDMGNYMKDARDKRKREFGPNTREGKSNELWTGNEVQRGVIKGPSPRKPAAS